MTLRWRIIAFVAIAVASTAAVVFQVRRGSAASALTTVSSPATRPARPFIVVRNFLVRDSWDHIALLPVDAADAPRFVEPVSCERVHYAADRGICLVSTPTAASMSYAAWLLDGDFHPIHHLELTGVPSRARMSPDGRLAAVTVFESGHSYADGQFSTRTTIIDAVNGVSLGHLEQFRVLRDGQLFHAADFNFWGVTFKADSDGFFATLATSGAKFLVDGRVSTRSMTIVRTGVECPSLSPDNRRIVYKSARRTGEWDLRILDLQTGDDRALSSERRSVDDQVEWLDDGHVLYHQTGSHGADVWMLAVDSPAPPKLFISGAYSPAVVR